MPDSNSGAHSDRSPARSEPVFGTQAAPGPLPYAILGRSQQHSLDATHDRSTATSEASEEPAAAPDRPAPSEARSAMPPDRSAASAERPATSSHSLRVSSGQVIDAEAQENLAGDEGKGVRAVELPPIDPEMPFEARPAEAMRLAQEAFNQTGYWVAFYRAILAVDGVVHKLFPTREEMAAFEETAEFAEIHKMMTALRTSDVEKVDVVEPQTMITIRMPRSLRGVLVEEAGEHGVSINKLCISKLLLPISSDFVPEERGKVRGRKPGQQTRSNRAKSSRSKSGG